MMSLGLLTAIALVAGTVIMLMPKTQSASIHQEQSQLSELTRQEQTNAPLDTASPALVSDNEAAPAISEGGLEISGDITAASEALTPLKQQICTADAGTCLIHNIRAYKNYVWAAWSQGDSAGSAIGVKKASGWTLLESGGGVMYPQDAAAVGVPLAIAEFVIPVSWDGSTDRLSSEAIESLSQWQLLVIRNSIFARHGRSFSTPRLREYFSTWAWYKPNPNYSDKLLTEKEKANLEVLLQVEKKKGYL